MLRELVGPVWKIPKGKVATYGAVARAAGYPRHARQVACGCTNFGLRGLRNRDVWVPAGGPLAFDFSPVIV
jgi:hypothetical protein